MKIEHLGLEAIKRIIIEGEGDVTVPGTDFVEQRGMFKRFVTADEYKANVEAHSTTEQDGSFGFGYYEIKPIEDDTYISFDQNINPYKLLNNWSENTGVVMMLPPIDGLKAGTRLYVELPERIIGFYLNNGFDSEMGGQVNLIPSDPVSHTELNSDEAFNESMFAYGGQDYSAYPPNSPQSGVRVAKFVLGYGRRGDSYDMDFSRLGWRIEVDYGALLAIMSGQFAPSTGGDGVTEQYVNERIAELVDSSPVALDTLNELATALGNDPNFSTTVLNKVGAVDTRVTALENKPADVTKQYVDSANTAQDNRIAALEAKPAGAFIRTATADNAAALSSQYPNDLIVVPQ